MPKSIRCHKNFSPWIVLSIVWAGPNALEPVDSTDLAKKNLNGPVRSVHIEFALPDIDRKPIETTQYNRDGNLVKQIIYSPRGQIYSRLNYSRNERGNVVEKILKDGSGNPLRRTTYKYDSQEREISASVYRWANLKLHEVRKLYSPEGRILEKRLISSSRPKENYTVRFKYDSAQNFIAETRFDHENRLIRKRERIYRRDGSTFREMLYQTDQTESGRSVQKIREHYLFDLNGHLIEKTLIRPDGHFRKRWSYEYDLAGRLISEIFYLKPDKPFSRWRYRVYPDGRLLEERYEKEGKTVFTKTYQYDKTGTKTESIGPSAPEGWFYQVKLDTKQNWIKKEVFKTELSGGFRLIGIYLRVIEYY